MSLGTDSQSDEGRALAHNAAQFIHCLAQGKVGSGFDVSAAIFGSQLYRRFDPSVIDGLMATATSDDKLLPTLSPSNKAWNYVVKPFQLPPCTRLMLADVDAGSDTPSLVGKVLKWRQAEGETGKLLPSYCALLFSVFFFLPTQLICFGTNWAHRTTLSRRYCYDCPNRTLRTKPDTRKRSRFSRGLQLSRYAAILLHASR